MSEGKCPKCGADKSQKMSSQHGIVYNCNSCQYIGSTGVPFIQADLCKKIESRNDKQNSEHKQMSDVKCPKCGAEKTDSVGWSCGSYELKFQNCKDRREFLQSDRCRGRADAIRELTEWRTGEPPEGEGLYLCRNEWRVGDFEYELMWRDVKTSNHWYSSRRDYARIWQKVWQWLPIPQ